MFVVLRHVGCWSDYTCTLIGVFDSFELADQAIDLLLEEQISILKKKLEKNIKNYSKWAEEGSDEYYKKEDLENYIERDTKILELLNQHKYYIENEKESFEIIDLILNKYRQYKEDDDDDKDDNNNDNDMMIEESFDFSCNIYSKNKDEDEA